jgi:hypothetical protein
MEERLNQLKNDLLNDKQKRRLNFFIKNWVN